MTDGFIEVSGGRIFYEERGDGQSVVFIHAGIADLRMWDDQIAEFAQNHRGRVGKRGC